MVVDILEGARYHVSMTVSTATQQKILDLFDRGVSRQAIPLEAHVSPSTVRRVLSAAGLWEHQGSASYKAYREQYGVEVADRVAQGQSVNRISHEMQIHHGTVRRIIEEMGLDRPVVTAGRKEGPQTGRPSGKAKYLADIRRMVDENCSQTEISKMLGIKLGTLHRWLTEEGIKPPRIDRRSPEDFLSNFGASAVESGRKGGEASGIHSIMAICEYCGEPFGRFRAGGSRRFDRSRFCCREHGYAHRRENSGKTTEYECQNIHCPLPDRKFIGWTKFPRKYCSRGCWAGASPDAKKIVIEGRQFDSPMEGHFWNTGQYLGVVFEKYDRSVLVEWSPGQYYGPDFRVNDLWVEVKGYQIDEDRIKWATWRDQQGPLAVVDDNLFARLRLVETKADFLKVLQDAARTV